MRSYFLVGLGAALGASARWAVGEAISGPPGFPYATLLVNIVGCALIGLAGRWLLRGSDRWQFAVTGTLGGLTTFSTFAEETRGLIDRGQGGQAALYVALSIALGLAATEIAGGRKVQR